MVPLPLKNEACRPAKSLVFLELPKVNPPLSDKFIRERRNINFLQFINSAHKKNWVPSKPIVSLNQLSLFLMEDAAYMV